MEHLHRDRKIQAATSLTRRHLVAATALTGAATLVSRPVMADSTPIAAAQAETIDQARLMALSEQLTGGATLDEAAAGPLIALLSAEANVSTSLAELEAVSEFTPESLAAMSPEAQQVATNILQYWFLGRYDDEPVANRADMFFKLASWQTLPYATQPTLCKSLGYWALEIDL